MCHIDLSSFLGFGIEIWAPGVVSLLEILSAVFFQLTHLNSSNETWIW